MSSIDCQAVVYGGGHAGAFIAKDLSDKNYDVVLVDPNDFFEVTSSIVRNLVEPEFAESATIPFAEGLPKVRHVRGNLLELLENGVGKVALSDSNEEVQIKASVVILATGSRYATQATRSTENSTREKRLQFYKDFASRVEKAKTIVIVGGGPIGTELTSEIVDKYKKTKEVYLVNGSTRLCAGSSEKLSMAANYFLHEHGVHVYNNTRATIPSDWSLNSSGQTQLSNGSSLDYDLLFPAFGGTPITEYMTPHWSSVLTEKNEIKVLPNFLVETTNSTTIFAVGDVAALNEPKLSWFVGMQVSVAVANAAAALEGKEPGTEYKTHPGDPRLGLTLGKDNGVFEIPYIGTIYWGWFARFAKSRTMMVPKFRKMLGVPPA